MRSLERRSPSALEHHKSLRHKHHDRSGIRCASQATATAHHRCLSQLACRMIMAECSSKCSTWGCTQAVHVHPGESTVPSWCKARQSTEGQPRSKQKDVLVAVRSRSASELVARSISDISTARRKITMIPRGDLFGALWGHCCRKRSHPGKECSLSTCMGHVVKQVCN